MRVIIDVTSEQFDDGFTVGVLGKVHVLGGEKVNLGYFDFFMMEDVEDPYEWVLQVYMDDKSPGVEIKFFPEHIDEKDYHDRSIMKWLAAHAEEIIQECLVQEMRYSL